MNTAAKAAALLEAVTDADLVDLAGVERYALRRRCEDILRRTKPRPAPVPRVGVPGQELSYGLVRRP
jgi:hypothetical protein